MGSLHSNVHFSVRLSYEQCLRHGEKICCTWKRARRRLRSQTSFGKVSSRVSKKVLSSSSWEHLLVVWYAELSKDGLVKTRQIRSFSTASVEHSGDCCQMTSRENPESQESQPLRIDVRPVHTDLLPPISTEPAQPRRMYIRNSVELARYGYTPGCTGCEAAFSF